MSLRFSNYEITDCMPEAVDSESADWLKLILEGE